MRAFLLVAVGATWTSVGCSSGIVAHVDGPHGVRLTPETVPATAHRPTGAPRGLADACDTVIRELRERARIGVRSRAYQVSVEVLDGEEFTALCDGVDWAAGKSSGDLLRARFDNKPEASRPPTVLAVFVRVEVSDLANPDAHSALAPDPTSWISLADAAGAPCPIRHAAAPDAPKVLSPLNPVAIVGIVASAPGDARPPIRVRVTLAQVGAIDVDASITRVGEDTRQRLRDVLRATDAR